MGILSLVKKTLSGIESDFLQILINSWGTEEQTYDVFLQERNADNLKFLIFNSF